MPIFLHKTSLFTVSSKPASNNMSNAHLIEKHKALLPTFEHVKDGDSKTNVGMNVDKERWRTGWCFKGIIMLLLSPTIIWQNFACRCGAHLSAAKNNTVNLILRLLLYHFLHTMSSWRHKSIHNNTNNQQTPPPWWWSRLPLQQSGFDESTPSEWRAALLMFVPKPLSKGFGRIN